MTTTAAVPPVSQAMVLAIVDEARAMRFDRGVLGVRGRPDRSVAAEVPHQGQTVRIRPAESALAAREVIAERDQADWLVVVTDRDDDDLGAGVLAHLVWQRLRSPDPWEAVRNRFCATGIDPALTTAPHSRELAAALLAATPASGWPAAPAGMLTRNHALGSVAAAHLGFDGADAVDVLRWSIDPANVTRLGALRQDAGEVLADVVLDWIAGRAGAAAAPVRTLLREARLADVLPLGVVLHLLTGARGLDAETTRQAQLAGVRLEEKYWPGISGGALDTLGSATGTLLGDLVHDRRADEAVRRVLDAADRLLATAQGAALARHSDLLPSGLRARFAVLAAALSRAVAPGHGPDAAAEVETAWAAVTAHRFAAASPWYGPGLAAVRLVRWLATPAVADLPTVRAAALGALARYHLEAAAWADVAIDDAFVGVDDTELSPALQAVSTAARERRRGEERRFARALAAATALEVPGDGVPSEAGTVWFLERLLPHAVIPLAKEAPVLLLVVDGMSAAVAAEIVTDVTTRLGWTEAALPGGDGDQRAAALAVLPSLTKYSRASMLCGRLTQGEQAAEQQGYAELTAQGGKITAALIHKKGVDTTAAGWSISHDVAQVLEDETVRLVTVVLNTVDDALDRSDPAGTTWTADSVKHLEPLLARAAAAGRTVMITADHGHIVERRLAPQRPVTGASSNRSRAAAGPAGEDEVLVSGPRVLTDDHRAVLAVDDTLRYQPLKSGYHGGASAAEVVVPVVVLVPGEDRNPARLPLLPPQQPTWWEVARQAETRAAVSLPSASSGSARATRRTVVESTEPALFDLEPPATTERPADAVSLGQAVVASPVFTSQRAVAGRLIVTDEQIARLVDHLTAAAGTRLPPALAARALRVGQTQLRGALPQVQQLLNVEGYRVIHAEAATGTVILDVALLREQFEVR